MFRYIQLPKMRGVLMIAVLLRFMDSFMIYTEPFVLTGGGPGNATTFLSQYLTTKAVGQFDLGPAAAFSLIYFFIILLLCFILYNWMQRVGTVSDEGLAMNEKRFQKRTLFLFRVPAVCRVAHLLDGQHELQDERGDSFDLHVLPQHFTWANYKTIFTDESWYSGYINSLIYVSINMVITLTVACLRPMRSRATASWATSMCSSGC